MVIASDGLFDFVSDQKVMQICANLDAKGKTPQHIAEALVHRAYCNWAYFEHGAADDITVIVVFLNTLDLGKGKVQAGAKLAEVIPKTFFKLEEQLKREEVAAIEEIVIREAEEKRVRSERAARDEKRRNTKWSKKSGAASLIRKIDNIKGFRSREKDMVLDAGGELPPGMYWTIIYPDDHPNNPNKNTGSDSDDEEKKDEDEEKKEDEEKTKKEEKRKVDRELPTVTKKKGEEEDEETDVDEEEAEEEKKEEETPGGEGADEMV